jgi:hypothetical protein
LYIPSEVQDGLQCFQGIFFRVFITHNQHPDFIKIIYNANCEFNLCIDALNLEALGNQGVSCYPMVCPPLRPPFLLESRIIDLLAFKFRPYSIIGGHMAPCGERSQIPIHS